MGKLRHILSVGLAAATLGSSLDLRASGPSVCSDAYSGGRSQPVYVIIWTAKTGNN